MLFTFSDGVSEGHGRGDGGPRVGERGGGGRGSKSGAPHSRSFFSAGLVELWPRLLAVDHRNRAKGLLWASLESFCENPNGPPRWRAGWGSHSKGPWLGLAATIPREDSPREKTRGIGGRGKNQREILCGPREGEGGRGIQGEEEGEVVKGGSSRGVPGSGSREDVETRSLDGRDVVHALALESFRLLHVQVSWW